MLVTPFWIFYFMNCAVAVTARRFFVYEVAQSSHANFNTFLSGFRFNMTLCVRFGNGEIWDFLWFLLCIITSTHNRPILSNEVKMEVALCFFVHLWFFDGWLIHAKFNNNIVYEMKWNWNIQTKKMNLNLFFASFQKTFNLFRNSMRLLYFMKLKID